jgi:hypothetical protein
VVSRSKLEEDARLRTMWAGYAFARDFREERGHAYMLDDQTFTERQQVVKQPGTCMQCHAAEEAAYEVHALRPAASLDDGEGELPGRHLLQEQQNLRNVRRSLHVASNRHHVAIAAREDQDVAGLQTYRGAAEQPAPARAACHDVVGDDVLGSGRIAGASAPPSGTSIVQGEEASTRKNNAPVSRTFRSTSDKGSRVADPDRVDSEASIPDDRAAGVRDPDGAAGNPDG